MTVLECGITQIEEGVRRKCLKIHGISMALDSQPSNLE